MPATASAGAIEGWRLARVLSNDGDESTWRSSPKPDEYLIGVNECFLHLTRVQEMDLNEAAGIAGYSREQMQEIVNRGIALPKSGTINTLAAIMTGTNIEILEADLDAFLAAFEAEEPGRHPPIAVRRALLVEANHRCAICRQVAPLQFHHMTDWAKIKHHDPAHMLAVCGTDHDQCSRGLIDYQAQLRYKARLQNPSIAFDLDKRAKIEADRNVVKDFLLKWPRIRFAGFLDAARKDVIVVDVQDEVDAVHDRLQSPLFHLHDKTLWGHLRDVFRCWAGVANRGPVLFQDRDGTGVAMIRDAEMAHPTVRREYEDFHQDVEKARHAFFLLHCYLREQFPDLDLDDIDKRAMELWKERKAAMDIWVAEQFKKSREGLMHPE